MAKLAASAARGRSAFNRSLILYFPGLIFLSLVKIALLEPVVTYSVATFLE